MQRLPLYNRAPTLTIESVAPATLDPDCSLCELGAKARKRCLPAVGEAGGLLVVDERPTREDEAAGQLFQSETARTVRRAVEATWEGPAAYATATRCVGKSASLETDVAACRGFMAQTLSDVRPKRIIVMGPWAAYSLLGRTVSVERARRAYAWTSTGVPVLVIQSPLLAVRGGRFHRRAFDEDLQWALTATPPIAPQRGDGLIVATTAEAVAAAASLRSAGWFSFDCETAGEMFSADFRLLCLSACGASDQHAFVWDAAALADSQVSGPLVQLLVDPTVGKTGQNLKYDMLAVRCGLGIEAVGVRHDTRLVRKLLEPDSVGDLDTMAELVGMGGHKDEAQSALSTALKTIGKKLAAHRDGVASAPLGHQLDETEEALVRLGANPKRYAFAMLPREVLLRYNARDAVATTRLAELLEARLTLDPELERVWRNVVLPASIALERVEAWGVAFDAVACGQLRVRLTRDLEEINRRFAAYGDFNPASSAQVSALLFDRLRLRPHHLTDSGKPSTDAESLEHLAQTNEVARDLLEHRRLSKLKGTYAEGLAEHVRDDGRIHPNIKLDGARSGRTSCSQPNLQQIPRAKDTGDGKLIRDCFVAPPGTVLIEFDYAQIELRVAAMLSGDPLMREIFISGDDYHLRTAKLVARQAWGIDPEQVEDRHRSIAKTFNFMVLYGGGDAGLAARIGCTVGEAAQIRAAILGKFKDLASWIQGQLAGARRTGETRTWWDGQPARRRPLWDVFSPDSERRSKAEHGSWNSAIQGTASDYCLSSLAAVVQWLEADVVPAKLVLAVHDSLLLEVDISAVDEVAHQVRRIMTSWPVANGVPLEVDAKIGPSWGTMSTYDFSVGGAQTGASLAGG